MFYNHLEGKSEKEYIYVYIYIFHIHTYNWITLETHMTFNQLYFNRRKKESTK